MTSEVSPTVGAPIGYASGPVRGVGGGEVRTKRIFLASFMTLIAAGIGFAVRGAILGDWGAAYGFTNTELGTITGGGLAGFGITIIICSFFADRIGYKALLVGAFTLHTLSAVLTLAAGAVFAAAGKDATYWTLFIGMFMFALGNGLCEASINPLTATLYPRNKTHWLNILHAGWPLGMIIGALFAFLFAGPGAKITHLPWQLPMAFFLVPTLWYGIIVVKERFPVSETHAAGVSVGTQIATVAAPIFIFLIFIHAMVGYVELGTDSWITKIMNNVIEGNALLLFIYISALMFTLRFFAGPIVHRINPLGLLLVSACLGATGLFMLGSSKSGAVIVVAATIFALGKTFYWPTMLGVAGEQFPKSGALGMGLLGGFGMMSAGFLGGPGIGYKQDRNASNYLNDAANPAFVQTYDRYKAAEQNGFLFFAKIQGLDGQKTAVLEDGGAQLANDIAALEKSGKKLADDKNLSTLSTWWEGSDPTVTDGVAKAAVVAKEANKANPAEAAKAAAAAEAAARALVPATAIGAKAFAAQDGPVIKEATVYGGQQALKITAGVPVTMAVCFLILVLYFAARGGYKQIHLTGEQASGGVEGPQEH